MANKPMKKCSTSLAIREIHIKTTIRYHHLPIRLVKIKNSDKPNAGEDVEKLAGGNVKWHSYSRKVWQFLKKSNIQGL